MSQKFPISKLTLALLALPTASLTHAAGLDRSGQDIKGFFNDGTYAEVDFAYIKTDISGHDNAATKYKLSNDGYVKGDSTGNITKDAYTFMRYGVKTDINENFSIGVFYDEPWGAEVEYEDDSAFIAKRTDGEDQYLGEVGGNIVDDTSQGVNPDLENPNYDPNTKVSVHTESWTGLLGYKSDGFQVYGGPVLQKAKADLQLRGQAYGPITGYEANVNGDTAYGWVAGIGYSIPEIALKANLTYRSEIEHKAPITESIPVLRSENINTVLGQIEGSAEYKQSIIDAKGRATTNTKVTTPESVNFNFQTGLSEKHQLLGTLDVRWVPWKDFSIVPPLYNAISKASSDDPKGLPLLEYKEDQWKVDIGLAKRFNEKLAGSVVLGWDSGAGDPTSTLGTIDGYYSVGGGIKYNFTPEWAISAGGKYMKFGDATGVLPNGTAMVSKFKDNDGYVLGAKLSYHGK